MRKFVMVLSGALILVMFLLVIRNGFSNNLSQVLSCNSDYNDLEKVDFIDRYRGSVGESIFEELDSILSSDDECEVMIAAYYLILTDGVTSKEYLCDKCSPIISLHPQRLKPTYEPIKAYKIVSEFCEN